MFSWPSNVTSLVDLIYHVNDITNSYFGIVMLLVVFIISYISAKAASSEKALMYSAFLTFITALFLTFAELLTSTALYISIIILVGVIVYAFFLRQEQQV